MHKLSSFKRGDTLIEVMLSVAIFGMVTVGTIQLMNHGVATAQGNLEIAMARNEIDTQAEALRFIHKAYSMNRDNERNGYTVLWKAIIGKAISASAVEDNFFDNYNNNDSCNYSSEMIISGNSFIINPRYLNNNNLPNATSAYTSSEGVKILSVYNNTGGNLKPASTYPRIIYTDAGAGADSVLADSANSTSTDTVRDKFGGAEGIWVTAVRSDTTTSGKPNYYDFYIRTCWANISGKGSTRISSIVRLYNPDATASP